MSALPLIFQRVPSNTARLKALLLQEIRADTRLALAEHHDDIDRETAPKAWKRDWKIRLIGESNPDWGDLSDLVL